MQVESHLHVSYNGKNFGYHFSNIRFHMKGRVMKRITFFLTVSVFLFCGIIQGPVCTLITPLNLDYNGYLNALKLDTVAWAKKPGKPKKVKKLKTFDEQGQPGNPIAVPEPSTTLLLGATLLGIAVFARKRFKRSK